jgi:hypothetical protein
MAEWRNAGIGEMPRPGAGDAYIGRYVAAGVKHPPNKWVTFPSFLHSSILPVALSAARWSAALVVLACLALAVYWNATGFRSADIRRRPDWLRPVMELAGLTQNWRMFTIVPKYDGWPRVMGELTDGTQGDLLEDRQGFDWRRRDMPSSIASNHRWRKYHTVLMDPRYGHLRRYYCEFLAERFESRHAQRVAAVYLYQVQEVTGPPGEEPRLIRRLLHHATLRTQGAFLDALEKGGGQEFEIHPGL